LGVALLDEWLPEGDLRTRYERPVAADPATAVAVAALGVPFPPDALSRVLFRVRGIPGGGWLAAAERR
jgi:hypothetical protein